MPALSCAPVSSASSPDPAPGEEHGECGNDPIQRSHNFMERRHLDLEPVDQSGNDECGDPGGGEGRESSAEEGSPRFSVQLLRICHALIVSSGRGESLQRLPGQSVGFPPVEWLSAELQIEIDRKLVPAQDGPLHPTTLTRHRDLSEC
jgi:hypothetical protein